MPAAAKEIDEPMEQDIATHTTINGNIGGNDVFVHQALYDNYGHCLFLDVTGHETILRSSIAYLAASKSLTVKTEVKELNFIKMSDAMGKRDHWQSKQWRIGNGAISNAIIMHPAMSKILSKKDDVAFGVITYEGSATDHLNEVKARMRQALPAYIDDDHMDNAIRVMTDRKAIIPLNSIGSLQGTFINFKREDFINEMLPHILEAEEVKHTAISLIDFMSNLGSAVVDAVRSRLAPVHTSNDDADEAILSKLKRRLFQTQANAVHAAIQGFRSGLKQPFNVAEMSCGKTIMSLATSFLFKQTVKAWVLCPPQLVAKWIREVHLTIPNAFTVNLNGFWAVGWILRTARERSLPKDQPCYMVIGRVQNRMERHLEPAPMQRKDLPRVKLSKKKVANAEAELLALEAEKALKGSSEKLEKDIANAKLDIYTANADLYKAENVLCCPKCATPITFTVEVEGEDGKKKYEKVEATMPDLVNRRLFCEHEITEKINAEETKTYRCNEPLWKYVHGDPSHKDMAVQRFDMMTKWLSMLPGISKNAATNMLHKHGLDYIVNLFQGDDMMAKLDFLYPSRSIRRRAAFHHLRQIPFSITPNDIPPFQAFKKKMPAAYRDFLIADEVHEAKADDSAQGLSYGTMVQKVRASLPLTGTLLGGYASDVFSLLFRGNPDHMKDRGYETDSVNQYQADEGILETIIQVSSTGEEYKTAVGTKSSSRTKKLPGFSPSAIARDLLPRAIFIRMDDIRKEVLELAAKLGGKLNILPSYKEVFLSVPMDETLKKHHDKHNQRLETMLKSKEPIERSTGMHALMSYLDRAHEETDISPKWEDFGTIPAASQDPDYRTPKEKELIKLCLREKERGRRVLVYVDYTGARDCQPRVKEILEKAGLKTKVMTASSGGSSEKREAWIEKQCEDGLDVLVCHAKLVATGLDLLNFPSIACYQIGFSIYTLRQAVRRSWRIGQRLAIRVYFLCTKGTYQEGGLTLMAKKLRTSLDTEGILDESCIDQLIDDDDTSLAAIARMLIEGNGLSMTDMIPTIDGEDLSDEFEADITFLPNEDQIKAIIEGADPAEVFASRTSNDDVQDEYDIFVETHCPVGNTKHKSRSVIRQDDTPLLSVTQSPNAKEPATVTPLFAKKEDDQTKPKQQSLFDFLNG